MELLPRRWANRGQQVRTLRLPWGQTRIRRTRVRDRETGKTYNLADRLLGLVPLVRRGVSEVRTACELAAEAGFRPGGVRPMDGPAVLRPWRVGVLDGFRVLP